MTDRRTDGQTDRQTDIILIARPRLRFMQRGKKLETETRRDETETLASPAETRPRRDVGTSRDRDVETETTTLYLGLQMNAKPPGLYQYSLIRVRYITADKRKMHIDKRRT